VNLARSFYPITGKRFGEYDPIIKVSVRGMRPPHIVTYREPASIGYVSNITIWGLPVIHKEIEPSKELGLALIP
jgi:hypothetical protein